MKFLILIFTFLILLLTSSCGFTPAPGSGSSGLGSGTTTVTNPQPLPGPKCNDQADTHACKTACANIFSTSSGKKNCLESSTTQVEAFKKLYSHLEEGEFDSVDLNALQLYMEADDINFIKLIDFYSIDQNKNILIKIAQDENWAQAFYSADENFKLLRALLKRTTGSDGLDALYSNFISYSSTNEKDTFLYLIAISENVTAEDLVFEYIESLVGESTLAIFTVLCKIGNRSNVNKRKDFLFFENIFYSVIVGGVNRSNTSKTSPPYCWRVDRGQTCDAEGTRNYTSLDNFTSKTRQSNGDIDWVTNLCVNGAKDLTL